MNISLNKSVLLGQDPKVIIDTNDIENINPNLDDSQGNCYITITLKCGKKIHTAHRLFDFTKLLLEEIALNSKNEIESSLTRSDILDLDKNEE